MNAEFSRSQGRNLPEIVMEELRSHGAGTTDSFLVAVSGGADSTALLMAMERGLGGPDRLTACYVDHGVRADTGLEREHVKKLCQSVGVGFVTGRLDGREVSALRHMYGSLEAGLRILRYRFLCRAAMESGSNWVLTGHTADDQAETVLFRAARGMNWRSLAGIPEKRVTILRPLLGATREMTRGYCRLMGIDTIMDPTNFDECYARNRIRIRVIPELEKGFHNGIPHLLRRLGCAAERLSAVEKNLIDGVMRNGGAGKQDFIDGVGLSNIPAILRERVILDYVMRTLPEYPSRNLLEKVRDFVLAGRNGRLSLPGQLVLSLSYGKARVVEGVMERDAGFPPGGLELKIPGEVVLPGNRTAIVASRYILRTPGMYHEGRSVLLRRKNLIEPLLVRNRRPGDRFSPLGMKNSKKLSDFMVDRKIPASARNRIPIVEDRQGEILWVAGLEISQKAALEGVKGEEAVLLRLVDLLQDQHAEENGSG